MTWVLFIVIMLNGDPLPITGTFEDRTTCIQKLESIKLAFSYNRDGICFIVTDVPTPRVNSRPPQ